MAFGRRLKNRSVLPVSAMADIAFLLLIFFMLSSISGEDKEIKIELPEARMSMQENNKFFNVWLNKEGELSFGAKKGTPEALTTFAQYKLRENPEVRVMIRASRDVKYESVNTVFEALKKAGAHYVVLVSEKKYE
jgi:biopolymer transport protein ExbD